MRRLILLAATLAVALVACDQGSNDDGIREDASVSDLRNCAGLEAEIERLAIREMNAEIDAILAGLDDKGGWIEPATAAPGAALTERDSATDYTTTNTQERDVDEPDFVKNDGSRIFVLHGKQIVALRAWPPQSARVESSVKVSDAEPIEMFLRGDRVVVFAQSHGLPQPLSTSLPPQGSSSPRFQLAVYDVSGAVPVVLHRQELDGSYVSARRTGDSVRFVSTAPRGGPRLIYWPDRNPDWSSRGMVRAALEEARAENTRRIKASTLADWLPRFSEDGRDVARDCTSFSTTDAPTRLGFTTVSTLDLDGLVTSHRTILSPADEVYASSDSLYLTARHYWTSPPSATRVQQDHTYIFKFSTRTDPRSVRYIAAGGVAGHIVDQFALDEEGGYLRVATTRRTSIGWRAQETATNVFILRAEGGWLRVVGELNGLARDEQIYSARFEGARGYLVTFRQVDPLFTLDLADPRQPRVAGELKVPGFSTYLHPLDRDHLLAIGREVSADGRLQGGVQIQLFDVSVFANPALMHRYTIGSASASSEAAYDHRAFTYFGSRGLLAIPFSDWSAANPYRFRSTLEVLRATVAGGIVPLGSIDHADLLQGTQGRGYYHWSPQVRRGVMMEDYVYSISYGGAKVHDTRNLTQPVATIAFP